MGKKLIIVESPAKIKTLKKFLGSEYLIESSVGHIRDLPQKEFGIDIEHDFEPKYTIMTDKKEVIAKLQKAAKQCDIVYLSPDPDREGEAIAWHIIQVLPAKTNVKRVSFNSITKDVVLKALQNPREVDIALVNAQQARRLLDRIVGYKISPILNRRIQRGKDSFVSAGRVQSVALKLVVDREREIEAFTPVEYWNLGALLKTEKEDKNFRANLHSVDNKRVEKEVVEGKDFTIINNKESADKILEEMKGKPFIVSSVEKKEKKRNPVPPFITSTLQQEASRHHGFSSSRTMGIAQGLYEGIDLGNEGAEGLITYMRTDSVRISNEGIEEAKAYILETYGKEYYPIDQKVYATKKSVQDAHEAIRPTNLAHTPEKIKDFLTRDQFMLYQLIFRRFISSQMVAAIYDTVSADISVGKKVLLRATGSIIKFPGFLAVYEEKTDEDEKEGEAKTLPHLEEGQKLQLLELISEQAFTRPPPRFSEASLVKELERLGIGRPSTYASIMNKIQSREYTTKEGGRLKPTEIGSVIAQMLETSFKEIMNVTFTAQMENNLELVAENQKDWKELLKEFWTQFSPTLEIAEKEAFVPKLLTDIDCPKCGNKLQKIWYKSKYFYGCSHYPDCDYSAPLEKVAFNKEEYAENFDWDQKCPKCGKNMKVRHGRFGSFLGCTTYPECKGIVNIPKKGEQILSDADMPRCPAIDCPGHMTPKKSRFGKIFFSCTTFPECNVIVNNLDDLESKYQNHPRTAYVKVDKKGRGTKAKAGKKETEKKGTEKRTTKATKKSVKSASKTQEAKEIKVKKPRNIAPSKLSKELAFIVGSDELSRPEATKKLWEYIKKHQLQDEKNKRLIVPDESLAKVFGSKEAVDMFKLAGILNNHFIK